MLTVKLLNDVQLAGAIAGMRNPYKNRDKSDSVGNDIGPDDLRIATSLATSKRQSDSKFLRMIHVTCDINAPLYWWKEMDQYKVATTTNSESTMHTIMQRPFNMDLFSVNSDEIFDFQMEKFWKTTIDYLDYCRDRYLDSGKQDKRYWNMLIQALPESYMQLRTWDGDYQTLRNIYFDREGHKLKEWTIFRDFIEGLPHSEWITQIQY